MQMVKITRMLHRASRRPLAVDSDVAGLVMSVLGVDLHCILWYYCVCCGDGFVVLSVRELQVRVYWYRPQCQILASRFSIISALSLPGGCGRMAHGIKSRSILHHRLSEFER